MSCPCNYEQTPHRDWQWPQRVGPASSPYAVDAPARDAGAASLPGSDPEGQRWMPSGAAKSSRTRTVVPFLQHRRASRQRWLRAGRMALGTARLLLSASIVTAFWIQHTRGRDGPRAAPAHIALVRIIALVHCTAKLGLESLRACHCIAASKLIATRQHAAATSTAALQNEASHRDTSSQ